MTDPLAETQVSQGITTVVLGPDGESPWPIGEYLAARRAGAARRQRDDDGRPRDGPQPRDGQGLPTQVATPDEVAKMAALVEQGMREGGGRALLRPRVRRRQLRRDRRARRAREGVGPLRRLLHDARAGRSREDLRGLRRGHRDRREGRTAPRDLPHQAGNGRRLGQDEGGDRAHRRGARAAASTSPPTAIRTRRGTRTSR